MRRNLVSLLGGIAVALYLFLPEPPRLYVPAGFAALGIACLLVDLGCRRVARGAIPTRHEVLSVGLMTLLLGLLAPLPFLPGDVALAWLGGMLVLWYIGSFAVRRVSATADPASEN